MAFALTPDDLQRLALEERLLRCVPPTAYPLRAEELTGWLEAAGERDDGWSGLEAGEFGSPDELIGAVRRQLYRC